MQKVIQHWHRYWGRYALSFAFLMFLAVIASCIFAPPVLPFLTSLVVIGGKAVLASLPAALSTPIFATAAAIATSFSFMVLRAATGFCNVIAGLFRQNNKEPQRADEFIFLDEDDSQDFLDEIVDEDFVLRQRQDVKQAWKRHCNLVANVDEYVITHASKLFLNPQVSATVTAMRNLMLKDTLEGDMRELDNKDSGELARILKSLKGANPELERLYSTLDNSTADYKPSNATGKGQKAPASPFWRPETSAIVPQDSVNQHSGLSIL